MQIEPFVFEVIQDALYAVTREMGAELTKIAYSTIIRESHDCATGFTDERGRSVAQSELTPGHFMTISYATKGVLQVFPADQLRPGDTIITNDPWICAGHLPDIFLLTPFFHGGELVGFVSSVAHHIDVGGVNPGSTTPNTKSIYDEGLQLPPVRLAEEGRFNHALLAVIRQNSRMPDVVATDLQAQLAVNERGVTRLTELCDKYGRDVVRWVMAEAIRRSEVLTREVFAGIPDGTYTAEDWVDDDYWTDEPVPIRVQLTVDGSDLYLDFAGSGPQCLGGINVTPSYRDAYTQMVIRCFTDPSIPTNEGCFLPVHVTAPEGSVLNPRYPAAVAGRHTCIPRLADVVASVLSQAVGTRAMAGYGGMLGQPVFASSDAAQGRRWMFFDNSHGGTGARANQDGVDCVSWPWNAANHPIEVLESLAPVRVERYELWQDSEGAGHWRGGLGLVKDYRVLAGEVNVQVGGDRFTLPATGLAGGGESVPQLYTMERDGVVEPVKSKSSIMLGPGDVFTVRMPGGGGYGPAWQRPTELVARDVALGYISAERAREHYGVAITDGAVDLIETEALRTAMRDREQGDRP